MIKHSIEKNSIKLAIQMTNIAIDKYSPEQSNIVELNILPLSPLTQIKS